MSRRKSKHRPQRKVASTPASDENKAADSQDKKLRFLVVDDDHDVRTMVKCVLAAMGHECVQEAENGEEALAALHMEKYDLVICDWFMPIMTGLELLKAMKAKRALKKIPFIMLTAEGLVTDIETARDAGVSDYIIKPCDWAMLEEKINEHLGLSAR